jgi:hypothetical protein
MTYTPPTKEQYLERPHIKELPQEVKDKIVEIRTTWEYVPFDIFRELHTTLRLVKRIKKLIKPRTLFTDGEKIIYFNFYKQQFDVVGFFHSEEFLAERTAKEEAYRAEVLENRRKKKEAKQKPVVVKPKRKRINGK